MTDMRPRDRKLTWTAMPHADVETSRFYTHIETGLPEPRRMRQLLTWCATRALLEKPRPADQKSDTETLAIESGEWLRQSNDTANASKQGKFNSS
jgi:hypothetical protein